MTGLLRHNRGVDQPTKPSLSLPADPREVLLAPSSHADFPDVLRRIARPVAALWYRGRLPESPRRPLLAIVGARAASRVGCRRTQELAAMASERGHTIISGGALGIDAAAHRGALDAGAPTFAVLGCGVDIVYPDRHADLFAEIVATGGGLLSEFPPGTPPRGKQFPSRNRIVAALAQAVLVVEAQARSGALVTAGLATRMGRPLLAVPGSAGTDGLIATGKARPVCDGAELLSALAGEERQATPIPPGFLSLIEALAGGAPAVEVARRLSLSLSAALALLSEAELGGWILRGPGGVFKQTGVTRAN
jgi:DNA processing protein